MMSIFVNLFCPFHVSCSVLFFHCSHCRNEGAHSGEYPFQENVLAQFIFTSYNFHNMDYGMGSRALNLHKNIVTSALIIIMYPVNSNAVLSIITIIIFYSS